MRQTQTGQGVFLLSPQAEQAAKATSRAPRLPTLQGATIALINAFNDPDRANADVLLDHLKQTLLGMGASQVLPMKKKVSVADMPEEMLSHIASQAQAVVILEGD